MTFVAVDIVGAGLFAIPAYQLIQGKEWSSIRMICITSGVVMMLGTLLGGGYWLQAMDAKAESILNEYKNGNTTLRVGPTALPVSSPDGVKYAPGVTLCLTL